MSALVDALHGAGVDFVASFPDTQLAPAIRAIERDERFLHVPLSREDEGVGVCAGAWLGGRTPCLLLQNSGLLECLGDLLTVGVACEIPMLVLVGYRGHVGEPHWYHGPAGRVTEESARLIGLRSVVLDDPDQAADTVRRAALTARVMNRPIAVLATLEATGFGQ